MRAFTFPDWHVAEPLPAPPHRRAAGPLRAALYSSLLALDLGACVFGFMFGSYIREGDPLHEHGIRMLVLFIPMFLAFSFNRHSYSLEALKKPHVGVARAIQAMAMTAAAFVLILFALKIGAEFSRLVFAVGATSTFTLLTVARLTFGHAVGAILKWDFTNDLVIVDEVDPPAKPLGAVVCAHEVGIEPTLTDPVMLDRVGSLLRNCDRVVLACPAERRLNWVAMLKGSNVDVEIFAPELAGLGAMQIRRSHNQLTVLVCCGPLGLKNRILKRGLDLAVALPLTVALLPLMILIAIAVKVDSKGPAFFRQHRVGRGNRMFTLLKFRTMRAAACDPEGRQSTERHDLRVTKLGRFLRRTSLDELPQLLNVVAGDMSIVGPRPHALGSTAEDVLFWNIDDRYWARHGVKPGITGLAQIRGYRGATSRRVDLQMRLQADLEYLAGWTLWRDMNIILQTARVLVHRNAF